jgi:oligopeptide transport system ATP-binding protein
MQDEYSILKVEDLRVYFPITRGIVFQRQVGNVKAVDGVDFSITRGETLGLVGESGSGKTTTGLAIIGLVRSTSGKIWFEGQDLDEHNQRRRNELARRMQIIFQDPFASLNPRMTIGNIIEDPLRIAHVLKGKVRYDKVRELMESVRLNPALVNRYPHQLSGGQRQRVGIARSLALDPKFIVCDEPVSALDVSIQAQILNLLEDLQHEFQLSFLFISHDLSVVRHISNRIAVMYLGKIVELSDSDSLYKTPLHPYTQALLASVHSIDPNRERTRKRMVLYGDVPNPADPPMGCHFCTRCPKSMTICYKVEPEFREVKQAHWVACHLLDQSHQDSSKNNHDHILDKIITR